MSPSKKSMTKARQVIYSQAMSLSIKRSAWILYRHQLTQIDPKTGRLFTRRKSLANVLKWSSAQQSRLETGLKQLSPMQIKIVEMLVRDGLTQKQIALQLHRDPDTIKHHCERIRKKVGVESLYQVVAVAVDQGWVTAPMNIELITVSQAVELTGKPHDYFTHAVQRGKLVTYPDVREPNPTKRSRLDKAQVLALAKK